MKKSIFLLFSLLAFNAFSQDSWVEQHYIKQIHKVPMSDGTLLYTHVFVPKDASPTNKYPFMMQRTCYSVAPYELGKFPNQVGPSETLMKDKYIFVYQDVRGRWMSEGKWTNMTPNNPGNGDGIAPDESSDTYDTIEWLLKNIPHNNGRVGQWGISYPGFYTVAGAVDAHPALKASSPQAPVGDFFFDDFHHNGAFVQAYLFTYPVFGVQHDGPTPTSWYNDDFINTGTRDGFKFQKDLGSLKNVEKYYSDNFYWQETVEHPNYDEFWQKRTVIPYLKNVNHAIMTVGGWFDAEDLYGPLTVYKTIEKNNPATYNTLVMGPFGHGRWSRETGHTLHSNVYFGDSIATFYQRNIEANFFNHFLKGPGDGKTGLPDAYLFDTGLKVWKTFDQWPSPQAEKMKFYLSRDGKIKNEPVSTKKYSEFESDPNKPVPYIENREDMLDFTPFDYMSEDQRFAADRPDVLVFETEILESDITLGGEIMAKLNVSTNATDADWVVKLIDVYSADEPNHDYMPNPNVVLGNYHQMVRSEAMRGRFRESFEFPKPFKPNTKTAVEFRLQDVLHTFKKGHKIQIQVQSTWFPMIDRNPQKYVDNIFEAKDSDFIKAIHRVYEDSVIEVEVLK